MAWLGTWAKRVKITIDHNDVDAVLTWFPTLVYLSASSGITGVDVTCIFDEVGANSKKIAVTKADGTTELYVEIEKWDNGNEKAWLWISRDGWGIASGADTDIYIYYDNTEADNNAWVGVIEARTEVWDGSFECVFHMRDKTTSSVADSTSNNRDGTKGGANTPPVTTNGKIDDAQDFTPQQRIDHSGDIVFLTTDSFTVEAWAKTDSVAAGEAYVCDRTAVTNELINILRNNDDLLWRFRGDNELGMTSITLTNFLSINTWYHIVGVRDVASDRSRLFVDGTERANTTDLTTAQISPTFRFGNHSNLGIGWNGIIDEIRISKTRRSDAWIKATYETGRDHLVTFGTEEILPVAAVPSGGSIIPILLDVLGVRITKLFKSQPFKSRIPKFISRLVI